MTPSSHTGNWPLRGLLCQGVALTCALSGLLAEEEHWAYQPIQRSEIPAGENPVDYFIHGALAEKELIQNPQADPHTLLRRATIDLTGLPPTRGEIAEFVKDDSDTAWSALVDRLLDSPHYGERWGRHWLDVARYVQGTIKVPGIDKIDLAEPYRDYVVRSFNEDKPYDRFIAEQIAGDLLAEKGESTQTRFDRITAPAFLSIGQWFDECTDPNKLRLDIIDEQISTATRAFLAHDFACSRCHDHKFDPIPTRDYYALAGIFRSTKITQQFSEEWKDGRPRSVIPLAETAVLEERAEKLEEAIDSRARRSKMLTNLLQTTVRSRESFPPPGKLNDEILAFEAEDFAGHKNIRTTNVGSGAVIESRRALDRWVKYRVIIPEPGNYTLLVRYAAIVPSPLVLELDLKDQPDRVLKHPTYGDAPDHLSWHPVPLPNLEKGSLHIRFKADRHEPFPVLDCFRIVKGILNREDTNWRNQLGEPSLADTRFYLTEEEKKPLLAIEETINQVRDSIPQTDLTLGVFDVSPPMDLPVHTGGNTYQTDGDPVPRGVPTLASHLITKSFPVPKDQSGRSQLANWLTHPEHPLTARVMVNRLWHWHFGTGLVRTVDDFGKQGAPPTHPELLDWLASEFIVSGWSIKHIHRMIMNSDTYRASSLVTSENRMGDADGTLLSRFPSRRLEVEALYDGMLTSIGKVPRQAPGNSLDTSKSKDRALYILTSSRSPMGLGIEIRKMFPLFGFDDSGRPMHDRDESLTPKQSLWWLNNPLPRHYADKLAENLISESGDVSERIVAAYETVLGRPPEPEAEQAFTNYLHDLASGGASEQEAWSRACLGLYSTRSFQFLE